MFYTSTQLDGQIAREIEKQGSAALGTTVTVASVKTKLRDGSAVINGLSVKNASGFTQTNAIEIDSFTASIDYQSFDIKEVIVDNPVINAELLGRKNNFQELFNNIPDSEDEVQTEADDEPVYTIQRLLLSNATVNLTADSDKIKAQSFVMDDLLINNLTGTSEQIAEMLSRKLSQHVSNQIGSYAQGLVLDKAKEKLRGEASKLGSELRDKLRNRLEIKKPSEDP